MPFLHIVVKIKLLNTCESYIKMLIHFSYYYKPMALLFINLVTFWLSDPLAKQLENILFPLQCIGKSIYKLNTHNQVIINH